MICIKAKQFIEKTKYMNKVGREIVYQEYNS
jgi:hypothetical protein